MKSQNIVAIDSYLIEKKQQIPQQIINNLYHFLANSYHLADQNEFTHLIIQPRLSGELSIQYGMNNEIAGFSRTYRQTVMLGKKQITVYSAYIYLNPHFKVAPTIESAGLTLAIKEKLANPQEELSYLAFANNPLAYKFIYQLNDSIYPKPEQRVPDQIISIVNSFKKQYGWISTNNHPMVVNSPLVQLRSQYTLKLDEHCELDEFYLTTNPDYLQGNSLLIYMPLHLANINYGLHHNDSNCSYNQIHHHNQDQNDCSPGH
ncbi:hypothetical protein [uncultured Legionella sp.]|uniref:hypothetical protein n=1 Tax=uncultured Legionella sp. TaxID=210934 RepID=UPI0026026868|nr:hypothetical protein [uncultured Legionella sp.]